MSQLRSLTCPSCGASLSTDGTTPEIKCNFCGNTVIVPSDLRAKSPEQPPVVVFQMPQQYEDSQRAGRGIMGCILAIVAISVIGSLVIGAIAVVVPMAAVNSAFSTVNDIKTNIPNFENVVAVGDTATPFSTKVRELTSTPKPTPGFANLVMTIGSQGTGPGYFDDARGVAVDGDGNIYVSEYSSGRVQKFDPQGKFVTTWNAEGKTPLRGLAADRSGNVFVVRQGAILKYNGDGDLKSKFQSDYYDDVATLPDGSLEAFSYQNSDDLIKLNKQGNVVSRIKGAISNQTESSELQIRVAVDGLGNIFALGTFNKGVFKFTRDGKYVSKFGEQGHEPGQFTAPSAIAVDNQGRIYLGDFQGIQVFSSEGRYLNVIKLPQGSGFPSGLAFDSQNALYAACRDKVYKFVLK